MAQVFSDYVMTEGGRITVALGRAINKSCHPSRASNPLPGKDGQNALPDSMLQTASVLTGSRKRPRPAQQLYSGFRGSPLPSKSSVMRKGPG